jgi:hypothetical protein
VDKVHLANPRQVALGPCGRLGCRPPAVAQQKFPETMAGAQLILLRGLARPH